MKKIYTLNLAAFTLLILLFSCQKDPVLPQGVKLPTLRINKISELPFSNTEWKHVFGGMAEIKYINGSTTMTDSLDLGKLSSYQKTLELGTYDIHLRSKSVAIADTFIRFSAELKGLVVDKGQAISLAASTSDGLITINKESIKEKTVPTFTPAQTGAKSYKMGLIDGYYFIYVTAGTSGQVSFESKSTNDNITKDLSIAAVNHYNLVIVTNGASSIRVELQKFSYKEVQVSSPTLITIKISPVGMSSAYESTFLISDEKGKILNSVKYESGMTTIKLASTEPYLKDRLSVFLLSRPLLSGFKPIIEAYMNVKKGSEWTMEHTQGPAGLYDHMLKMSLKYVPDFQKMTISADWGGGLNIFGPNDIPLIAGSPLYFTKLSKIFFQVEYQGKAFYNFFDISKDAQSFEIDPALCIIPSLSKTINLPGPGEIRINARKEKNSIEYYHLGLSEFRNGSGQLFYPDEPFEEYTTISLYEKDGYYHQNSNWGPVIEINSPLDVTFQANGRSLSTFKPTFTGKFDYYSAFFHNDPLDIYINSPSAALSSELVYPDFAAFPGFSNFDTSRETLVSLTAYQYDGFAEDKLRYRIWQTSNLNTRAKGRHEVIQ